jgi:hypothetical protein
MGVCSGIISLVAFVWFILFCIVLDKYNTADIHTNCAGLYEFMVCNLVIPIVLLIVMICSIGTQVCYNSINVSSIEDVKKLQIDNVHIFAAPACIYYVVMHVIEIYIITKSWTNDACQRTSESIFNGTRWLEIFGWIQITFSSIHLTTSLFRSITISNLSPQIAPLH